MELELSRVNDFPEHDDSGAPVSTDKGFFMGLTTLGLTCWASLSLIIMLVKSWLVANWDWVTILSGLLCFSAALSICAWKHTVLDYGESGEEDELQ
jgi:hypothetical protein